MTLDQYQPCPGGLDKKIKFCCKDLVSDLDKITRSFDGEQFEATLQHIDRLLPKYPDRQCLWAMKSSVLMQSGKLDQAKDAIDAFLKIAPENPVALANSAVLRMATLRGATEGETDQRKIDRLAEEQQQAMRKSVVSLHQALAHCGEQMPLEAFQAVGFLGHMLIDLGHFQAGREHLLLQFALVGDEAEDAVRTLLKTGNSPHISLLLKQETRLPEPVDWVQWKEDYIAGCADVGRTGAWTPAADQVTRLITECEPHPVLLRAQAALCCRLPDPPRAAAALRQLANCDDIPLEEAVEAEALAQVLDPAGSDDVVDLIRVTYTVIQADVLQERMLASRQTHSLNAPQVTPTEEGPPPKATFALLDRDLPLAADQLNADTLPEILCECCLYGKQTDREARLELVLTRPQVEQAETRLREISGDSLANDPEEQVLIQVSAANSQLTSRPVFPPRTPYDVHARLLDERRLQLLVERWPHIENPDLDHLTPTEAAGDPKYQRRLLGTLLRMEQSSLQGRHTIDYDVLREKLKLPVPQPIKATGDEIHRLPLVRLARLDPTQLNDRDLIVCFQRASQSDHATALLKSGTELVSRELRNVNLADIYGRMSQATGSFVDSLNLLHKAQAAAVKKKQSPAAWMIPELTLRIMAGQSAEAQELLNRIQSRHVKEPGIAQMLMQALQRLGLVTPDGQPVTRSGAPPAEQVAAGAPPTGTTSAPPPQRLWTPDGGTPPEPPQTEEQKPGASQLWIPGMD